MLDRVDIEILRPVSHMSQNLTLEEIGRLAGVSRSTVSRVLNDHPEVRQEVRQRVEAVIESTGYLPNQAARALVSNRTGVIGLIMTADVDELFGDPYYSALVHGIQRGCVERNAMMSIFPVYGDRASTQVLAALVGRGLVDGVIVTAGPRTEALIGMLRDRGRAMVVIGHPRDSTGIKRVDVDSVVGSRVAVGHLIELGRRRIGFVAPDTDSVFVDERLDGYRQALSAAGLAFDPRLVQEAASSPEGGAAAAGALVDRGVDAIHVATDTMAVGVLRALIDRGIDVPGTVAVVGFDGLPGAPRTDPELSTVVQPVDEVGRAAVSLLLDDADDELLILPTSLRVAASSRSI